jgi:hypothetical protein
MADTTSSSYALPADSSVPPEEMRAHRLSYMTFERLVLFSLLHIALVLACLALAFLGDLPVIAFLFGAGGSLAIIAGFVIRGQRE